MIEMYVSFRANRAHGIYASSANRCERNNLIHYRLRVLFPWHRRLPAGVVFPFRYLAELLKQEDSFALRA